MLGVISDLIRTNRILIEHNLEHTKRMRFGLSPHQMMALAQQPALRAPDRIDTGV
jgi:hypothetical protein